MILYLNTTNENFNIGNISCIKRDRNAGEYILHNVGDDLLRMSEEFNLHKKYFDCEIKDNSSLLLIGKDCWFNSISKIAKTISLVVGWVEKQEI